MSAPPVAEREGAFVQKKITTLPDETLTRA